MGSNPSSGTMDQKTAIQMAHDLEDKDKGVQTKVGTHKTNGVQRYAVHVTQAEWVEKRNRPYTIE